MAISATTSTRGTFLQGSRLTLFLRLVNANGLAVDASAITYEIFDNTLASVKTGIPERGTTGFYALDWNIPSSQTAGDYTAIWTYTVGADSATFTQPFTVQTANVQSSPPSLYAGRALEFRQNLELMIAAAQSIVVYSEPAKASSDQQTFFFTFPRWNPGPGSRIYRNNLIMTSGVNVDYGMGSVTFTDPITSYDKIKADYNFRWFKDEELDRFISNGLALVNLYPPASNRITVWSCEDRYIPLVLWAAAVDALRYMMMSLQFQEPQMVFGGPDAAAKAYSNFADLKKNYEESLKNGLEKKKFGPYVGLTKTVVTPEFALPGGRSRWFRYLFSGGA